MRDGVRLAVDVWLPQTLAATRRVPTALRATRYWRASDTSPTDPEQDPEARRWLGAGYALVTVDARGSGASFGHRTTELSQQEIDDYGEVLDWIAAQPWSTGRVGMFGVSYDGDTAELTARLRNPHLTAVAARFADYDVYEDAVRPGGASGSPIYPWSLAIRVMDGVDGAACEFAAALDVPCEALVEEFGAPRPVDGPVGRSLLAAARREHQPNLDLREVLPGLPFRDDEADGFGWDGIGVRGSERAIERSRVPILLQGSWLDAATANGLLSHLLTFGNPQEAVLGGWNHGGSTDGDPFHAADAAADPSPDEQWDTLRAFFDRTVKAADRSTARRSSGWRLRYYTLGEGRWRSTDSWPPAGTTTRAWHLAPGGRLSTDGRGSRGSDTYVVDPTATTGRASRWNTGFTEEDVVYPDRRDADARLLTYTGAPLPADLRVTGMPVVTLRLAVDRPDADLHVYLEDVAGDGTVTYITEGVLRLSNRATVPGRPADASVRIPRSFARADAAPMVPGAFTDVTVGLVSTSVLFRRGHRIRIAIAGADADNLLPPDGDGQPTFVVDRGGSTVRLPVARGTR